jgi:hypothetical protein
MALQIYDRMFIFRNGKLSLESDSVEVEFVGDPLPVATNAQEFAGVTPVPKHVRFNVSEFVPTQGEDLDDAISHFLKTQKVQIAVQRGGSGKIIKTEGFFTAPKVQSGAADHTKATYSIMCSAKPFV